MTIFGVILFAALIGAVAALLIVLMLIQCRQRLKASNARQLERIQDLEAEISDTAQLVEELHIKFFAVLGDAPQSTSRNARRGVARFDPWSEVSE